MKLIDSSSKITKSIGIFFTLLFLFFHSCKQKEMVVEKEYSLVVNDSTINNQESLTNIKEYLESSQSLDKLDSVAILKVNIHEEISKLFAPEGKLPCQLPKKIIKKIKKTRNWTPRVVRNNLRDIPAEGDKVANQSVVSYLNSLIVKPVGGEPYEIEISSSPDLDMINFVDRGRSRFAYSLDCSGYLNAALEFSAGASATNIKNSASSSLSNNGTVLLVRANVTPPIVEAVRKTLSPSNRMKDIDVFTLLVGLKNELRPDSKENDIIVASKLLDLLWTSSEGDSNLNGKASLSGGVRFIGIQFSADAGGSLTRKSSFTNFDTYVLNEKVKPLASPIRTKEVNKILTDLAKSSQLTEEPKTVNGNITFELLIPSDLSGVEWKVKGIKEAIVSTEKNGNNKIKFTVSNLPSGTSTLIISRNFKGVSLEKSIKI